MAKQEIHLRDGSRSWYWRDDADREPNLLVFVHGYTGDAEDTWQRFPFLVRQIDEGFDNFEVASFGYETNRILNRLDLDKIAGGLLSFVDANAAAHQQVYFVTHSLGGLVVRRMLVKTYAHDRDRAFFDMARQVHFIGVPHLGANMTGEWLDKIRQFNPLAAQLRADSPILIETLQEWGDALADAEANQRSVPVPFNYVGDRDVIAPMEQQLSEFTSDELFRTVQGSHIQMVKPLDASDVLYQLVRKRILADAGTSSDSDIASGDNASGKDEGDVGIKARVIKAQRVGRVQIHGKSADIQLARDLLNAGSSRTWIEADTIEAGDVGDIQLFSEIVADSTHPQLDELTQAIESVRAELAAAVASEPGEADGNVEDVGDALAKAAAEAGKPEPDGGRVKRQLKQAAELLTNTAEAAKGARALGAELAKLAPRAAMLYKMAASIFGG